MKKIVGTIAAAALVASAAFAEIGIGFWGRGVWTPVDYDAAAEKVNSWEGVSWGGNTVRTGISIHGDSENVGFNIDYNADGNAAGVGDTAYFWAKPWSFLELKMGKVQDNTGRGDVAFGIFNWKRQGAGKTGEDVTFTRFGNGAGGQANGAIIKVTPIEGLWAIAAFDVQDSKEAALTFGNHAQYGVGYDISGIGSIRAQYIGGENTTDIDGNTVPSSQINAAFDLTAVENLRVTVGAFVPLSLNRVASSTWKNYDTTNVKVDKETGKIEPIVVLQGSYDQHLPQVTLSAGTDYTISSVTLHALFVGKLPNTVTISNVKSTQNFSAEFGLGADIDLGNGIGINLDARYSTVKSQKSEDVKTLTAGDEFVFLAGITKGLASGMVGIGFQGDVQGVLKTDKKSVEKANFNWCIPVVISAWF